MAESSVTEHSRWDDFMLVRAFDSALQKYQEMHGHAVDPPPEHVYPASSAQGDASEVPSLDHLRLTAFQTDAAANADEQVSTGEELDDIDDAQLEDLIQAAHALQVESEEGADAEADGPTEAVENEGDKAESSTEEHAFRAADGTGKNEGHAEAPVEEYTDAQYYEWLHWQATQQGAAAAADQPSSLQTVVHHHHHHYHYYPSEAANSAPAEEVSQEQSGNPEASSAPPTSEVFPAPVPPTTANPVEQPSAFQYALPYTLDNPLGSSSLLPHQAAGASPHPTTFPKPPYQPTSVHVGGPSSPFEQFVSISAMKEYSNKSVEELHFEEYPVGTHRVPFDSTPVQEEPWAQAHRFHSMTAMAPFSNKSLEELHWDDCAVRRRSESASESKEQPAKSNQKQAGLGRGRVISLRKNKDSEGKETVPGDEHIGGLPLSQAQTSTSTGPTILRSQENVEGAHQGPSAEEPPVALPGLFSQPIPSASPSSSAPQSSPSLPEIDLALQDLLSAYYWMGYQTARYLQSRHDSAT